MGEAIYHPRKSRWVREDREHLSETSYASSSPLLGSSCSWNSEMIRGVLDDCDNAMNVIIKEATIGDVEVPRGSEAASPCFLRGSNILFVHSPENADIMQLVEDRVSVDADSGHLMLDQAVFAYMEGKGAPAPKPVANVGNA